MKRIVIFLTISLFSLTSFAQSTQKGVVKEYNDAKKKIPLAGVELVVNNAGSNVSGKDGRFTLSFRTLKPGDKVDVRKIEKTGYEIFNKDALDAWRIANDGSEFTVVLCKSAKFKALKDQYNAVSSKSYAKQQKKDEDRLTNLLKEGKLQQAEYEKKLKELKDKYDEQLENLDNYIDRFARIDLETLSKEEQRIIEMVKEGKIEEAIKAYEDMHLEEKYAQAVKSIAIANEGIEKLQDIKTKELESRERILQQESNMNNLLMMQGGADNFNTIAKNMMRIADMDTTNIGVVEECAYFLYQQNRYDEAEHYFYVVLNNCRTKISTDRIYASKYAKIQGMVASIYFHRKNYQEAKDLINNGLSVLELNREFIKSDYYLVKSDLKIDLSEIYVKMNEYSKAHAIFDEIITDISNNQIKDTNCLVRLYNSMGTCYSEQKDFAKAEEYHLKGLQILQDVEDKDSDNYLSRLSTIYMDLAAIAISQNHIDDAIKYSEMCIKNFEDLYEKNPEKYVNKLSAVLNNTSVLHEKIDDFSKAEEYYLKAYSMRKTSYEAYPEIYALDYIQSINNLTGHYKKTSQYDKALEFAYENLSLSKQLFEKDNYVYRKSYAKALYNIGLLNMRLGEYSKAIEYLLSCKDQEEILYRQDPVANDISYAQLLDMLSDYYSKNKDFEKGLSFQSKVVEIYENLYQKNHDAYAIEYANALHNAALSYMEIRKLDTSLNIMEKAINIISELQKSQPRLSKEHKASYLKVTASIYVNLQQWDKADSCYLQALKCYEELVRIAPEAYYYDLVNAKYNYATYLVETGNNKAYDILTDVNKELSEMTSETYDSNMQQCHFLTKFLMAQILRMQGVTNDSVKVLMLEGESLCKELYDKYPDVYALKYYYILNEIGLYEYSAMNLIDAEQWFIKCQPIIERICAIPDSPYHDLYVRNANNIGVLQNMMGKNKEATETFKSLLAITEKLYATDSIINRNIYVRSLANYGLGLLCISKKEEAHEYIKKAISFVDVIQPVSIDDIQLCCAVNCIYGYELLLENKEDEAIAIYQKVNKISQDYFKSNQSDKFYQLLLEKKLIEP